MRRIFSDEELEYIKSNYNYKTYKQITEEINAFNAIKKSEKQVRTKAATMGLSKTVHKYDRRYFKNIDTREKAYWLGFIYADGYIMRSKKPDGRSSSELGIEVNSIDKEHLCSFEKCIGGSNNITTRISKDRYIEGNLVKGGVEMSLIRLFSADMVCDLIAHNIVPNKTYKPEFPKIDEEYFYDFLRGYFDGDGCVYYSHNKLGLNLTCSNVNFLQYLANELEKDGVETSIHKEKDYKYRLNFKGDKYKILSMLYNNSNLYLKRKYDIAYS